MPTDVSGVRFFRSTGAVERTPVMYEPGIIIIGQGQKTGYLGDQAFRYDADHYLILTAPLPLECETQASESEPLLGVAIDIEITRLMKLVSIVSQATTMTNARPPDSPATIGAVPLDTDMRQATTRLLRCLSSREESLILGGSIVGEILYRALCGPHGCALYALAQHDSLYTRVVRVLNRIHTEFDKPLTVEELAKDVGMSTSAFHRAFKGATADSPLQYLKKVRLNKAKSLIAQDGVRANVAAHQVGYESASQFSREFKRYFKVSPSRSKDIGYATVV